MGLGFVELNVRIERRFGIRVPIERWREIIADRQPMDLTAGEVCSVVAAELSSDEVELWPAVRETISLVLAADRMLPAVEISQSTWLYRDLQLVTT